MAKQMPSEIRLLPETSQWGDALVDWLFAGYALLMMVGFVVFRSSAAMVHGNEMSVDRAFFTTINAITLTGFQQSIHPNEYLWAGKVMLLVLTVGGSVFNLMAGGLAVVRILRLPYSDRQVVAAACVAELVALLAGAAVLVRLGQGDVETGMQAAGAFGNSGLYMGKAASVFAWQTHLVLLPLAMVGGLGVTVLMELFEWIAGRRKLSLHARTVLGMSAGLYVMAMLLFFGVQMAQGVEGGWQRAVVSSSAAAMNCRTAGLPLEHVYAYVPAMQWIMVLFMVIGASPGGTGGGLKTTTVVELIRGAGKSLRGERPGRGFGIAVCWAGLYLLIVFCAMVLMLGLDPQMQLPTDRLLFMLVSAVSNVGLSHDPISLTRWPLMVLAMAMLAGRVVAMMILWWAARTVKDGELAVG